MNSQPSSAYKQMIDPGIIHDWNVYLWKIKYPSKVRFFGWLAMQQRLLTADNLMRRGWPHLASCTLCNTETEDGKHLFMECP
ncbi:hypothetical protein LUZ60_012932 [Juncus effusus]|nr:hypothetical protein LUZ60_012932 [Juncus effusus]